MLPYIVDKIKILELESQVIQLEHLLDQTIASLKLPIKMEARGLHPFDADVPARYTSTLLYLERMGITYTKKLAELQQKYANT